MSTTKLESEQEYIFRKELQDRRREAEARHKEMEAHDREKQKELHWMRCAKCGSKLEEITYRKIKIDKCFSCGGTYLDKGELEQLAGEKGWLSSLMGLSSDDAE